MLNLEQDQFMTQYMTTFLATWSAEQLNLRGESARNLHHPVEQAIRCARVAWCDLMQYGLARSAFQRGTWAY